MSNPIASMVQGTARYFDGQRSTSHVVQLKLEPGGPLEVQGDEIALTWPLRDLALGTQVGFEASWTVVHIPTGASCQSANSVVRRALSCESKQPHWENNLQRMEQSGGICVGAVGLCIAVLGTLLTVGIPYMAGQIAALTPTSVSENISQSLLQAMETADILSPTELPLVRRRSLLSRFEQAAQSQPELSLELRFYKVGVANAFALPDGTVVVTDKLVKLLETDDRAVAVLWHEIGHVKHRHGLESVIESSATAVLLTTILGDLEQFTVLTAGLPAVYLESNNSRGQELQADKFAQLQMDATGLPRERFVEALSMITETSSSKAGSKTNFRASHPVTPLRLKMFIEGSPLDPEPLPEVRHAPPRWSLPYPSQPSSLCPAGEAQVSADLVEPLPWERQQPTYPADAHREEIQGWSDVRYVVDQTGRPCNIEAIGGSPQHLFDEAALAAVKQWTYQPPRYKGQATAVSRQETRISFELRD